MTSPEAAAVPTRLSHTAWRARVTVLQARRLLHDLRTRIPRRPVAALDTAAYPVVLAVSRTPLWSDAAATPVERPLQRGKVQNLRCALRSLNGLILPAGALFSFWRQVGRATARRGYAPGRELREGCILPSPGGGLCQLSNALYAVALEAGAEIVERHRHSRIVPGSAAESGRDATVFWNYLDLRFRLPMAVQLEARLTRTELVVTLRGVTAAPVPKSTTPAAPPGPRRRIPLLDPVAHGCLTCGQERCFQHAAAALLRRSPHAEAEPVAFLLDECWPELRTWILAERVAGRDHLAIPLDGARWRTPRYAWPTTGGFAAVHAATPTTLLRTLDARRQRGAAPAVVRAAQLRGAERLAAALARTLTADVTHVCVSVSLLPYLWRDGHLGGRTFDVLLTRFPLHDLHARLDDALARFPDRHLLGDFRAPAALVAAESEALAAADRLVTPHVEIAALFGDRAIPLPWQLPGSAAPHPAGAAATRPPVIAFPGPTAARKGAYEVRDAARALGLTVVLVGRDLEGPDFWTGIPTRRATTPDDWLTGIAGVVQPSLVEDQPRPLLRAIAAGLPVIATPACGLGDRYSNVTAVPALDAEALITALRPLLGSDIPATSGTCAPHRADTRG